MISVFAFLLRPLVGALTFGLRRVTEPRNVLLHLLILFLALKLLEHLAQFIHKELLILLGACVEVNYFLLEHLEVHGSVLQVVAS